MVRDDILSTARIIALPQPTKFERLTSRSYIDMATNYSITVESTIHGCKVFHQYRRHQLISVSKEDLQGNRRCESTSPATTKEAKTARIEFYPDIPIEDFEMTVYCVALVRFKFPALRKEFTEDGLVLKPVHDDDSRYRRIGLYQVDFDDDEYPFPLKVPNTVIHIV